MRGIFNKFEKYIAKIKRDGLINATKKAFVKIKEEYLSKVNPISYIKFLKNKKVIGRFIDRMLFNNEYDRIILWRSSIGYNIPLFQRPQQLANLLSKNNCLVLYEASSLVDNVDFISKINDRLYLVNYDNLLFNKFLMRKINIKHNIPKYLYTASTCWDFSDKTLTKYIKNGFKFLYDYLDALSPELAGTDKIPYNVEVIHNFVINNIDEAFVICTADELYNDIIQKRGSDKNVVFSCNGVNIEDFKTNNKKIKLDERFKSLIGKKPIIGYYGALATWFDYELIKKLATERPNYNIVLIGAKYDTSFSKENLEEYDNIYYFEPKKYSELPAYSKNFDVCILPFKLNEITASTNPIKIFEYMAVEKPIVSTDLRECRKYKSVLIGHDYDEYISLIDQCINKFDKKYKTLLRKEASENTWNEKALTIIKGLKKYESNTSFKNEDEILNEILSKIYDQNYDESIKEKIIKKLNKKDKLFIVTINSEICVYSQKDEAYKNIILDKDVLLVPDSISMSYVMYRSFKQKIKRYPGIELLEDMLKILNEKKKTIYLYGATEKVNTDMVKYVNNTFKNIKVVGYHHGYVDDEQKIVDDIIKLKPDAIVVALGVPRQELFISKVYDKISKGIFIGVGGSFDVLSGNAKRAPLFMRKINLEWLYRILKEPSRFNRFYNNNIKFVLGKEKKK